MTRVLRVLVLVVCPASACYSADDSATPAPSTSDASDSATSTPPASDGGATSDGTAPPPPNDASTDVTSAADTGVDAGPTYSGEATWYVANGTGACGFAISNDDNVAALNGAQYTKANCNRCAHVTGPQGEVTVRIVDKCPGCKSGDLDLSETAFTAISPLSAGRVDITWQWVPCP